MNFHSILFKELDDREGREVPEAPDFFRDLNLDQIVNAITSGREEYNLKPFYYSPLTNPSAIAYRHEVARDLENEVIFRGVKSFSQRMRASREHLAAAEKISYKYQKERWFFAAIDSFLEAVGKFFQELSQADPTSNGLRAFLEYLAHYTGSDRFKTLTQDSEKLRSALSSIKYCLLVKGSSITVRRGDSEIDYSAAVEETFAKFKQGAVKDYRVKFPALAGMNHVETQILERVARLNSRVFLELDEFCVRNGNFLEKTICDFDREIQFYVSYREYTESFRRAGLNFCYPKVSDTCKDVCNRAGFDLSLAGKLSRENTAIVCNDFFLRNSERILVVTGPNQGGKSTFARTFGQVHYLSSLGCLVPGTEAQLFLFDQLFTHFEREEHVTTLRGKLQDDLFRIHGILVKATTNSIIIINEIFSATSVRDAVYLSRRVMESIAKLDLLCVCVTFLDEIASLNEKTVSVVAAMMPDNPTMRTYRIERRPADGLAYAMAIAEKHGLTQGLLKERMKP